MYYTIQAIVLQTVKYGETSRVLKCYTDLFGLQSYMVNGVNGKKAVVKPGMMLPLTNLTLIATQKGRGTLERIKEARVSVTHEQLYTDPVRNALALFVAEVLTKCLKTEQGDRDKFDFVSAFCRYLDMSPVIPAHVPQFFLVELSRHLGFYPQAPMHNQAVYFDSMEGCFCSQKPLHPYYFDVESSAALHHLLQKWDDVENLKIPRNVRKLLMRDLLIFYRTHVTDFGQIKSIEVFEEVFG